MGPIGWSFLAGSVAFGGLAGAVGIALGRISAARKTTSRAAATNAAAHQRADNSVEQVASQARESAANSHKIAQQLLEDSTASSTRFTVIGERLSNALSYDDLESQLAAAREALGQLVAVNADLALKLREAQSQLGRQRAAPAPSDDPLTELPGEEAFLSRLASAATDAQLLGTTPCLLLLDVDALGRNNQRLSRDGGDYTLRKVAGTVRSTIRETDVAFRLEGDGFAVLFQDTNLAEGIVAAERLRRAVAARAFHFRGQAVEATISLGIAAMHRGEAVVEWRQRAESALRAARRQGRNSGCFHNGQHPVRIDGAAVRIQPDAPAGRDRRRFNRRLRVAALLPGATLPASEFCLIPCREITAAGFAFLSPQPVTEVDFVVEMGEAPHCVHVKATARSCHAIADENPPRYRVDCQFSGRLSQPLEQ